MPAAGGLVLTHRILFSPTVIGRNTLKICKRCNQAAIEKKECEPQGFGDLTFQAIVLAEPLHKGPWNILMGKRLVGYAVISSFLRAKDG